MNMEKFGQYNGNLSNFSSCVCFKKAMLPLPAPYMNSSNL